MQTQHDVVIPDPCCTAGFSSSSCHRAGLVAQVEAGRKREGMAKWSRPFGLDEDYVEATKRELGEVPSSERWEGLCCFYPVVLGGFFVL